MKLAIFVVDEGPLNSLLSPSFTTCRQPGYDPNSGRGNLLPILLRLIKFSSSP